MIQISSYNCRYAFFFFFSFIIFFQVCKSSHLSNFKCFSQLFTIFYSTCKCLKLIGIAIKHGVNKLGPIHKRRRNILGGGEGCHKFRCCKILEGRSLVNQGQNSDMGRGLSKTAKKIPTSFMDGPLFDQ